MAARSAATGATARRIQAMARRMCCSCAGPLLWLGILGEVAITQPPLGARIALGSRLGRYTDHLAGLRRGETMDGDQEEAGHVRLGKCCQRCRHGLRFGNLLLE